MERYRLFLLAEQPAALVHRPRVRRRRPSNQERADWSRQAWEVLLLALDRVNRRGPGENGWACLAEDPLSFVLEGMSDPLVLHDSLGRELYTNPAARRLQPGDVGELQARSFTLNKTNPGLILTLYSRART